MGAGDQLVGDRLEKKRNSCLIEIHAPPAAGDEAESSDSTAVALVVFTGTTCIRWLKPLRTGFRHCFVVVFQGDTAIICDPLSNRMILGCVQPATPASVAKWYCERGFTVVVTELSEAPPSADLLRPLTCVEAVKRVLAIRAPFVLTPWQLYRHLLAAASNRTQESLDRPKRNDYIPSHDRPKSAQTRSLLLICGDERNPS